MEIKEYYINNENNNYKLILSKRKNTIIIQCNNYNIQYDKYKLSCLIKGLIFDNIDIAYNYFINKFEQKKVIIKDIIINKKLTLLVKKFKNKEEGEELILLYNNEIDEKKILL
jgi:hypothetical protein